MTDGKKIALLIFGFIGACIVVKVVVLKSAKNSITPATSQEESAQVTQKNVSSEPEPKAPARPKMGDTVYVGYWYYICQGVRWRNSIGDEYSLHYPDAKFLVIDLQAGNEDRTASTLPPAKLVDPQGREYDASSAGIWLFNSFDVLKTLNPGVASRGYIVFDVPRGTYALKVSGGYTSGESELIDLQRTKTAPQAFRASSQLP